MEKVYKEYSRNDSDKFFIIPGKINRYVDIALPNSPHFRIKQPPPPQKKDT